MSLQLHFSCVLPLLFLSLPAQKQFVAHNLIVVADSLIWVSAHQLPHPFQPNVHVHLLRQEGKHPNVSGWRSSPFGNAPSCSLAATSMEAPITTAATVLANQMACAGASLKRDSHGWGSSSDDDDHYSSRRVPTPWVSSSSQPPPPLDDRVPTTPPVSAPPGFQSTPIFRCRQLAYWLSPSRLPFAAPR